MELPGDILSQIKEFSRPITRPDWRGLHLMPLCKFLEAVADTYSEKDSPVIHWFVVTYNSLLMQYIYIRFAWDDSPLLLL